MPSRIASLWAAATDILCAFGRGDLIVGVSHECVCPPEIVGCPVLTEPRTHADRWTPAATATESLMRLGVSIHAVREKELRDVRPDLVVTRDAAEKCGVTLAEVEGALHAWLGYSAALVSLRATRLDGVLDDIRRLASATRCEFQGRVVCEGIERALHTIRERATRVRAHPRVACIEEMDPLTLAGDWIPDLVALCGGTYGLVPPGTPAQVVDWNDLVAYEPEVVILMPRGLTLAETRRARVQITARSEWLELPAVRNKRVYSVDATTYLYRPGPRIAEGAALLAGLIQPSFFASRIPVGSYELVR